MGPVLDILNQGLEALRAVDHGAMTPGELGRGLIGLQRLIDGLNVEQAKLMTESDKAGVHAGSGHRTMASWLAANGKTSFSRAKRQQQLGDAINASPKLDDAVTNGDLTPDCAGELLPTLDADHSGDIDELIDACKGASPAEARAAGERFQELNKPVGETDREREAKKRAKRSLRFNDLGDGMTSISGLLPSPDARTVRDSLAAIARRWNDSAVPQLDDGRSLEQKNADALVELCKAFNSGEVTGGREAPTVMVVINIDDVEGSGVGYNTRGEIVPAEIVRRMVPNANLARIISNGSEILDLGRSARLASPAQFRAIIKRDGSFCRMPGCCMPATWCQVDHVQEWSAQHGNTDLDWLILLCNYHHHMRHLPGVELHGDANDLSITLPNGDRVDMPPKPHVGRRGSPSSSTSEAPPGQRPAA